MSQTKISDFFVSCKKKRSGLKRKSSIANSDALPGSTKRIAIEFGSKNIKVKNGLCDIRVAFEKSQSTKASCDEEDALFQNGERTPKNGVFLKQEYKLRRKQSGDDYSVFSPIDSTRSVRKRIFDTADSEQNEHFESSGITRLINGSKHVNSVENKVSDNGSKLTLTEVKHRLANCSKLSELRYRLAEMNDCSKEMKEFELKSTTTKSSTSVTSPKKYLSTVLSPEKRKHAFQEFTHLAKKDHETGLALPFKFRTLLEIFRCTDFVVSLLYNRNETCTFDKLKKSVEEMTRKSFDIWRLNQILEVFPDSYKTMYEKANRLGNDQKLIVTPKNVSKMTPSCLIDRKEMFHKKLVDIVKRHHSQFLLSLNPPINVVDESLQRWHPNFQLENIPDINPKHSSIQSTSNLLAPTFASSLPTTNVVSAINAKVSEDKIESGVLKGISASLLQKIRDKEAVAIAREMVRKPEDEKKLEMMTRLPELMKIIHNYFVCDGRSAMRMDDVLKKCVESYHTFISVVDVKTHVTLLTELLPEWIFILNVRKGEFLKIDRTLAIPKLIQRLENMRSKIKHE
ncbi:DNA replication factor Cdt1-like protein [Leptotrombidium deliense]|uniref:DNA replication factor Cdt1-like protein n=1 Tax=Leptotrombidium deliense TaxID=299467 RepID=A0A443SLY6_9ACAR|nr:DNA replication factor Cdt1-like protein [Leptotrombidium deliense]